MRKAGLFCGGDVFILCSKGSDGALPKSQRPVVSDWKRSNEKGFEEETEKNKKGKTQLLEKLGFPRAKVPVRRLRRSPLMSTTLSSPLLLLLFPSLSGG
mmetsp:Transcript_942/g.3964  ORF Transcript_942/g.3964 Transcript_942/m.3964 type:complete len:99 (+) Transcript_942:432-728(+)